ncbi:uncharacterized protein [Miscanthus floridulus]|uniref:uncharacterized protein n=1 Tax=Miscanthus floridulus TaxID=154761 RepID=UPI003458356D
MAMAAAATDLSFCLDLRKIDEVESRISRAKRPLISLVQLGNSDLGEGDGRSGKRGTARTRGFRCGLREKKKHAVDGAGAAEPAEGVRPDDPALRPDARQPPAHPPRRPCQRCRLLVLCLPRLWPPRLQDRDDCLILGTVDSYGHLIVSCLDIVADDIDRTSYSVPPRDCGVGEGSWAGICFSPIQQSMVAVARELCKTIDIYDQDIHVRSLRTLWYPSSFSFVQCSPQVNGSSSLLAIAGGSQLSICIRYNKENGQKILG